MVGSGTAHVSHCSVTVLLTLVLTSVVANSPEGSSRAIEGGTGGERRHGWEERRAPEHPCSALTSNVQHPGVKGRKGHWPHKGGRVTVGFRRHKESSRTQDLHGVVPHGLPSLAGHNAAVGARVLFLGIQDLQPVATWAKGVS